MSQRGNYRVALSRLLPAGAVGVSVLLGAAAPGNATEDPANGQPSAANQSSVSERLAAIRQAVSAAVGSESSGAKSDDSNRRLAWGNWNNWGWYRPRRGWGWPNWNNWRNWNNWPNWWRNW